MKVIRSAGIHIIHGINEKNVCDKIAFDCVCVCDFELLDSKDSSVFAVSLDYATIPLIEHLMIQKHSVGAKHFFHS